MKAESCVCVCARAHVWRYTYTRIFIMTKCFFSTSLRMKYARVFQWGVPSKGFGSCAAVWLLLMLWSHLFLCFSAWTPASQTKYRLLTSNFTRRVAVRLCTLLWVAQPQLHDHCSLSRFVRRQGGLCAARDIWRCREVFWIWHNWAMDAISIELLEAADAATFPPMHSPPGQRMIPSKMSVVLSLRNPALQWV